MSFTSDLENVFTNGLNTYIQARYAPPPTQSPYFTPMYQQTPYYSAPAAGMSTGEKIGLVAGAVVLVLVIVMVMRR